MQRLGHQNLHLWIHNLHHFLVTGHYNILLLSVCFFFIVVYFVLTYGQFSYVKKSMIYHICIGRPVVPGCAGCAIAHPIFGWSVNPISTRGDRLYPPNYYWHTRIFRPSDSPECYSYLLVKRKHQKGSEQGACLKLVFQTGHVWIVNCNSRFVRFSSTKFSSTVV